MTKILKLNPQDFKIEDINIAARVLKDGGTVVFPTETVYGLGANALDPDAVRKIFIAKGRPADNPLIVHIWNIEQIEELVSQIPSTFYVLAERFWPGPLTLVMKKSFKVPDIVTAGLDTVGIRMPNHPIALALLMEACVPVSAPSANISGSPSPTRAEHAINDLNGKVDVIIDGGICSVGLESTVVDITGEVPVLLRPGGVTAEQIKLALGEIIIDKFVYDKLNDKTEIPKSPGVKYKHYSPKAEVILVDGFIDKVVEEINRQAKVLINNGKKVGIMATEQTKFSYPYEMVISVGDRDNPETIASNFFNLLRYFDELGVDVILIEGIDRRGIGMAIMNRMIKSAEHIISISDNNL